jgi:hypothetical protein
VEPCVSLITLNSHCVIIPALSVVVSHCEQGNCFCSALVTFLNFATHISDLLPPGSRLPSSTVCFLNSLPHLSDGLPEKYFFVRNTKQTIWQNGINFIHRIGITDLFESEILSTNFPHFTFSCILSHTSVCRKSCLFARTTHLPTHPPACLPTHPLTSPLHPSLPPSLPTHRPTHLPTYLPTCLPACPRPPACYPLTSLHPYLLNYSPCGPWPIFEFLNPWTGDQVV